ncbi:MAG: sulfotransferase [Parcubacteria group bacterium]|nr:sulfotransferase [Parcubacteria group bacterium]
MKTIVVIGMHRSGTSLTASILNVLGVHLGKKLIGATSSNPLGHFENAEFVELNDTLLLAANGDAAHPPSLSELEAIRDRFAPRIKNLIARSERDLWGWKDPRTSLTISLYFPFLRNPYFIHCKRNPNQIAESLQKRSGMRRDEALRITRVYEERIKEFFERNPDLRTLEISYEEMLENTQGTMRKLIAFLELQPAPAQLAKALSLVLGGEDLKKAKQKAKIKGLALIPFFLWYDIKFFFRKFFLRKRI